VPDIRRLTWAGVLRLGAYALAWMPLFAIVFFVTPIFRPMFLRLEEKGELSPFRQLLMTAVGFDQAFHHVPALVGFVAAIAITNFVLVEKLRVKMGPITWAALVIVPSIVTGILLCNALMLPVYRHPRV
jgi:hypothetical protein